MTQNIYVFLDDTVHGPFSIQQVRQLIAKGKVRKDTQIRIGEDPWAVAHARIIWTAIPELFEPQV